MNVVQKIFASEEKAIIRSGMKPSQQTHGKNSRAKTTKKVASI